jgi:hypothetical protein
MAANDERTGFLIPGNQGSRVATIANADSQDLALRYRYDLGRQFTFGTLMTARSADDYDNTVLSADFNWQAGRSDRVVGQVMRSESSYPAAIQTSFAQKPELNDTAWFVSYNHQGRNWSWNFSNANYGEDFRADLGFIGRVNYREQGINPGYTWLFQPGHFFNRLGIWTSWNKSWDQDDRELAEATFGGIYFQGLWQSYGEVFGSQEQRYYNGQYFDLQTAGFFTQFQPIAGMQIRFNVRTGDAIDFANTRLADNFLLGPGISFQLGKHLQVQFNHNRQRLEVPGGRLFTTDLSDLRLTYQFDTRSFVRAVLVYSDTKRNPALYRNKIDKESRSLGTQLLYSYRYSAQTRFFVGYSDSAMDNDSLPGLEATYRTVFAKFSYAWQY